MTIIIRHKALLCLLCTMAKDLPDRSPVQALHGITIWLDTYDDIFSDFDPREYDVRALSDDFVNALRKIVREDEHNPTQEFYLLIPASVHDHKTEEIVSRRLHNYFRKILQHLREDVRATRKKGILFMISGLVFLLCAGYISFLHPSQAALHLLMVALEPAGWFFIWMGYDNLVSSIARKRSDVEFHSRMNKSRIIFKTF
jgi:hypothetical protein